MARIRCTDGYWSLLACEVEQSSWMKESVEEKERSWLWVSKERFGEALTVKGGASLGIGGRGGQSREGGGESRPVVVFSETSRVEQINSLLHKVAASIPGC